MAQDISATNLGTSGIALARIPCFRLRIAWGAESWPSDWSVDATDETANMLRVDWSREIPTDALGQQPARLAQLTVELDNSAQRFSPHNTGSAITASIRGSAETAGGTTVYYSKIYQTPVQLEAGFFDSAEEVNEYVVVFTGVIDQPDETFGLGGEIVRLRCVDRGLQLADIRTSTTIREDWRPDDWIRYIVATVAGISGGSYDNGLYTIPFAWADDERLLDECNLAATADGGLFFFDELGVPQYKNALWLITDSDATTSQQTLDGQYYQDLDSETDWATVATGVMVEYSPRSLGGDQDIYRSQETLIVPTDGLTIEAQFSYPAVNVYTPSIRAVDAGGTDLSEQVTISLSAIYAQRCTVTIANNSGQTVFVPDLTIRGSVVTGGPVRQKKSEVGTPLLPFTKWERISANEYVQSAGQADMLAELASSRMRYPRLMFSLRNVPALPWLQLGDMVTVSGAPLSSDRTGNITRLSFRWSPSDAFLMSLECIDRAGLFEYADYVESGSVYGDSETDDAGRVFI